MMFHPGAIDHWAPQMKSQQGGLFGYHHADGLIHISLNTGKGEKHGLDHMVEMKLTDAQLAELIETLRAIK